MNNISNIFEKIIVDGNEIDLQSLVLLNGNVNVGKQKDVNVEYIFKDDTQIPSGLFKNLNQLKYAYFPKAGNIKTIGEQAFINSYLSYINDLSYVNYIGAQAFSYTKLSYVYNGDAPSNIDPSAWSYIDTLNNDFKETLRRKYPDIDFGNISYNSGDTGNEGDNEQGNDDITSYNYTIINCDFNNGEVLFVQQKDANGANRTTITNTDNILVLNNASNSSNGNSCAKYDFSNYINENTYKVNIQFDIKLTDQTPVFHNIFTLGDSNLRTHTIKEYNNTGAIFNIGTKRGKWNNNGSTVNYFTINNQYIKYSEQDGYNSLVNNWLLIKVSANLQEKTISYKIIDKSNAQIIYQESNINYIDENANVLNIIDYDSCINNASNYIDNLIIEKETYTEESQQSGEQDEYIDTHNYQYYEEYTKENINRNTISVAIEIDNSHIELIESGVIGINESENQLTTHNPNIVIGNINNTSGWGNYTTPLTLSPNNKAIFKFKNYSSKQNNYNNFVVLVGNETFNINDIFIALRADNWENIGGQNSIVISNYNWDTFKDDLDGAYVKVVVTYENNSLTIRCDIEPNQNQQSGEQTIKQDVTLTYDNTTVDITGNVGDEITLQEVNCSYSNAQITFSIQSDNVITENVGKYYIANEGQAIVTANYAGDDTHNPATAQYTINVTIASQEQNNNQRIYADLSKYATGSNGSYDGIDLIFSWNTPWGNQLGPSLNDTNIGLPTGDYTSYKLVITVDEIINCDYFRILLYSNSINHTLKVYNTGKTEFILQNENIEFINNVTRICISGADQGGMHQETPDCTIKIKEIYLEIISNQEPENPINKQDVTLTYDNTTVDITGNVGDEITLQEVNCSYPNAQVTFTIQSNGIITENDGRYYIVKEGQATVIANYTGDDTHNPATAQYIINITIATQYDDYTDTHNYQYYEEFIKENINNDNVTVAIGVDNSYIELIESGVIGINESESHLTTYNSVIGNTDNTSGWGTTTTPISLINNQKAIFKFTNYSSKQNNWNNFAVLVSNEIFDINNLLVALRADNWENITGTNTGIISNYNFDTFKDDLDGAYVKVVVTYENNSLTIRCDIEPNQ